MRPFAFLVGLLLIAVVLWDAFETVVLPRTVTRRLRLAALYFQATWNPWARVARMFEPDSRRERFLAIYGPLSLLGLLTVWALGLILGFAVLQWAAGSQLQTSTGQAGFFDDMKDRPVRSAEWTPCEIVSKVDEDATFINFGVVSVGRGRVWPALNLTGAATRPRGDRLRAPDAGPDPLALVQHRLPLLVHLHHPRRGDHRHRQRRPGRGQLTRGQVTETKAAQC